MLGLLVSIVIALVILSLLWWIVTLLPLPAPFARIAQVVFVVIAVIWVIYMLLPFAGAGGHPLLR